MKSPLFWAEQFLKDRSSTAVGEIKPKSLIYKHPLRLNVQRHNKQVFLPEKNWAGRCGLVTNDQERSRPLAGSRVRGHRPWLFPETRNTDGKKTHRSAENTYWRNSILELLEIKQTKFKEENYICQLPVTLGFWSWGEEQGLKNRRGLLSRHSRARSPLNLRRS